MALSRSDENRHDLAFIAGAVVGAIAGALVTLALTPMSGPDTREKLRSRAEELGPIRERAMDAAAPMREKAGALASTAAERGKTLATDLAHKAPIGRTHDDAEMSPEEANARLSHSDADEHPGGTVTPAALFEAGVDDADSSHLVESGSDGNHTNPAGTIERPPRMHTQDAAEGERDSTTEPGNGRISEEPSSN